MASSPTDRSERPNDRRRFLKASATAVAAPLAGSNAVASNAFDKTTTPSEQSAEVRAYKRLGRTGLEVSDISFGSSRLRSGEERLVAHALNRGINYFDTAESYTGGQSETVLGRALKGQRDKVIITSKQFARAHSDVGEMMAELEGSLRRLQTDYVDIYMNHAVNHTDRLKNPAWGEFVERAKAQGKLRFTGMSGHAGRLIENLDYALDENLVDVILVAYNFGQDPAFYERLARGLDTIAKQPDLPRVLAKAKSKDVGVIAMKTLRGARLNDMRPFEKHGATYAQAAFRWVLSNTNVDALVISMTETATIDEYLGASGSKAVASTDMELLRRYAVMTGASYCAHACNDCEGACPHGVPIADVLRTRMYATDYRDLAFARDEYAQLERNATACLSCDGSPCASACTHGIPVASLCAPTHRMLA